VLRSSTVKVAAAPSAVRLGSELAFQLHEAPDPGAVGAVASRRPLRGAARGDLREHCDDRETHRGRVCLPFRPRERPQWNYAIGETRKISEGSVGVGTTYHQVRSVPSRSEERLEITAYAPPRQLRYEASSGPSRPACSMPWTPPQRELGSPTRWRFSSAVRAAYSRALPCLVSEMPWPPTSGSSRNCWRDSMSGTHWRQKPAVSTGQPRTVPASQQPGRWRFRTPHRRSRDRWFRAL
jgi:hypothetical protein